MKKLVDKALFSPPKNNSTWVRIRINTGSKLLDPDPHKTDPGNQDLKILLALTLNHFEHVSFFISDIFMLIFYLIKWKNVHENLKKQNLYKI